MPDEDTTLARSILAKHQARAAANKETILAYVVVGTLHPEGINQIFGNLHTKEAAEEFAARKRQQMRRSFWTYTLAKVVAV